MERKFVSALLMLLCGCTPAPTREEFRTWARAELCSMPAPGKIEYKGSSDQLGDCLDRLRADRQILDTFAIVATADVAGGRRSAR